MKNVGCLTVLLAILLALVIFCVLSFLKAVM